MRLHTKDGIKGRVIDLDTGRPVRWVIWLDTDLGSLEHFTTDPATTPPPRERAIRFGRFRFDPGRVAGQVTETTTHVRRISQKRLPGWIFERHDCSQYGCHRQASWEVADLVRLPPAESIVTVPAIVAADGRTVLVPAKQSVKRYAQGTVVKTSYWCNQHYQRPHVVFPDGSRDPLEISGHCGRPQ